MKNIIKVTVAPAPLATSHAEIPIQIKVKTNKILKAIVAFFFKLFIVRS
ncbi:Hypothetical protein LSL_0143 [Ligilactobacillus salivarius UCC118]|uniref:Uncharacterized protein n=1 Tax=Ligilactobacillus salivarius (strain UCC118) TaxID=362948 RepID=Q1WVF7_LIGS1|nr:Hypothetical protein LSL_0143 [Ligilactobacillus salivarius UCC118]